MVRTVTVQSNMTAGILGVAMAERDDTEDYFRGLRDLHNMDPRPQGGAALRPGLAYYGVLRKVLAAIDLAGASIAFGGQTSGGGTGDAPPPPPADEPTYPDIPDWVYDSEGGAGVILP